MSYRKISAGLMLALSIPWMSSLAISASPPAHKPDPGMDRYAHPARLVSLGDGRKLNLYCSGEGGPSVILEAGFAADSMTWSTVQLLLAKQLRVCSYDRAGWGFSDIGPMPRSIENEAQDLHALIKAAAITMPVVLVGHSLGTNILRRFDQMYPAEVSALVLLDPPPQDVASHSAEYAEAETRMLPAMFEFMRRCEAAAQAGQLAEPADELKSCIRSPDPAYSEPLNQAIRARKLRPDFWMTLISASQAKVSLFDSPVSADESHGDKPLVVMTAEDAFADATPADRQALEAAREQTHAAIAGSSKQGRRVRVSQSGHAIQVDQPEQVVTIILDVVRQVASRPD